VASAGEYLPSVVPAMTLFASKYGQVNGAHYLSLVLDARSATTSEARMIDNTSFTQMTASGKIRFVSTSAQDAVGGSGCKSVEILTLDTSGHWSIITIVPTGETPGVTTTNHSIFGFAYSTDGTPAGDITFYEDTDTNPVTYATLATGDLISNGIIPFESDANYGMCLGVGGVVETRGAGVAVSVMYDIVDDAGAGTFTKRSLRSEQGFVQDVGCLRRHAFGDNEEFIPYCKALHTTTVVYTAAFFLVNHA